MAADAVSDPCVQKGPVVPFQIPDVTVGQFLLDKLRARADETVVVDAPTEERVSGRELVARAVGAALELQRRGVGAGDVVATALGNCPEDISLMLATLCVGAVYAPFNPDLHTEDVTRYLRLLRPRVVLCSGAAVAAAEAVAEAEVVEAVRGRAPWEAFLAPPPPAAAAAFQAHAPASGALAAPAVIVGSSGTTGPPKGVVLPNRSLLHVLFMIEVVSKRLLDTSKPSAQRASLLTSHSFWVSGLLAVLLGLQGDAPLVLLRRFDAQHVLSAVQAHRVAMLTLSPAQVGELAKHPSVAAFDLSSLELVCCGGAAVSRAVRDMAERRVGKPLLNVYGMTESMLCFLPGELSGRKRDSVGLPAINTLVKVVDVETGKSLGPNEEGEVCVKNPMLFTGYFDNPAATAETRDEDGWVHTGDAGYYDEDGYFYVCDRIKELIKYKGVHMAPSDVEGVLMEHEGVRDAAVVGIEHETDQEHPVAFVVRQPGSDVTAEELRALAAELPVYKQLHGGVFFIDEIPRTASGKIKRRELRQRARTLISKESKAKETGSEIIMNGHAKHVEITMNGHAKHVEISMNGHAKHV